MNDRLTDSDYGQLLSCIEGVHACRRLEDFPQVLLTQLRKLVACKMACYAELDYGRGRALNVFDPPTEYAPRTQDWFERLIQQHPVLEYFKSTGDGQALKISDFMGADEFHALDLYKESYRLTGAEDQMGFGVRVRDTFILGVAFDRGERSFTERDRKLLNLIRPHIIQAYLHLEELAGHEELQRDLEAALRENGLGVIVLDEKAEIVHATPGAFERLASYVPVPLGRDKLPQNLADWAFAKFVEKDNAPFVMNRNPSRLLIRRVRQHDRVLLLLSEQNGAATVERLARYHLTPRELEVLHWIAEGKSNAEIAIILGITVSTAKQHVERILSKLGVENRTAAALLLQSLSA